MPRISFLSRNDIEAIHAASLEVLEGTGVLVKNPNAVELLKGAARAHSKSSIYSVLDEYLKTAKKEYAESCSKREKIKNDISELDKKKQRAKTELEDFDNITQEKAIEANHLREEVDKLRARAAIENGKPGKT